MQDLTKASVSAMLVGDQNISHEQLLDFLWHVEHCDAAAGRLNWLSAYGH